jgi:TolB protein
MRKQVVRLCYACLASAMLLALHSAWAADAAPATGAAKPPAGADAQSGATPKPVLQPYHIGASLLEPGEERHLRNIRQLSFGHSPEYALSAPEAANYAEAYWSPDMRHLILQSTRDQWQCDELFELDLLSGGLRMVNDGRGRVTCGYFTADGEHVIYSSTAENGGPDCPARPDYSHGYVWPVYATYDVYLADLATGAIERNLTHSPGYDAEATIDWCTGWMYFTSDRDGDLDIYRLNLDTDEVQRLTNDFGYDGGPFISYDGQTIVYRKQFFKDEAGRQEYSELLKQNLIRPGDLEIMAMNSDGSNTRQLTNNGASNFAPFLHPDNETVIFSSNMDNPGGRYFELYTVPLSGGAPERITYTQKGFESFAMFSPDGKYIVWCSNRDQSRPNETNIFVAE